MSPRTSDDPGSNTDDRGTLTTRLGLPTAGSIAGRLAGRLAGAAIVLLLVACGIFALLQLAPGDAATMLAPEDASAADLALLRTQWGLDQPLVPRFGVFLLHLARLDLGVSLRYQEPVARLIGERLPATVELAAAGLCLAVLIGVPLGIAAALHQGRAPDMVASLVAVAGVSAPAFWIGILLVLLFSAQLHLLPSSGRLGVDTALPDITGLHVLDSILQARPDALRDALAHLVLPATTLALGMLGIVARVTRASIITAGQQDFVLAAVAKGLRRGAIVRRHLLPNAAIPVITIIGLELGVLLSGTIIVEVVFAWPGLGSLLYQAVTVRDTPLTTGVVVVYAGLFILLNLLIDASYVLIDPRLRRAA